MVWRRVRDSNPRFLLKEHIISSDAPSTSRTTLRAIFQPNFSNLNLGKWREKLERKLFNVFNCIAKTPINQGLSRRGFQSDHWFSSQPRYDHFDTAACLRIIPHFLTWCNTRDAILPQFFRRGASFFCAGGRCGGFC